MNQAVKASLNGPSRAMNPVTLRAVSFFHSTPALERKRRTHWNSTKLIQMSGRIHRAQVCKLFVHLGPIKGRRLFMHPFEPRMSNNYHTSGSTNGASAALHPSWITKLQQMQCIAAAFVSFGMGSFSSKRLNNYAKRMRRMESKRALLRNISEYAEQLFQSWRADDDRDNFSSVSGPSWFRRQYWSRGSKKNGFSSHEPQWESYRDRRKGGFDFCSSDDDDEEVETMFRSTFGGERGYYWSFDGSENFHRRYSSGHANHRSSWKWRSQTDDEAESGHLSDLASERLVLGLNASGPLRLEEVKSAYRACALRWHPDRHQGSSKAIAEEKFKSCSAAYKSLCDRLVTS